MNNVGVTYRVAFSVDYAENSDRTLVGYQLADLHLLLRARTRHVVKGNVSLFVDLGDKGILFAGVGSGCSGVVGGLKRNSSLSIVGILLIPVFGRQTSRAAVGFKKRHRCGIDLQTEHRHGASRRHHVHIYPYGALVNQILLGVGYIEKSRNICGLSRTGRAYEGDLEVLMTQEVGRKYLSVLVGKAELTLIILDVLRAVQAVFGRTVASFTRIHGELTQALSSVTGDSALLVALVLVVDKHSVYLSVTERASTVKRCGEWGHFVGNTEKIVAAAVEIVIFVCLLAQKHHRKISVTKRKALFFRKLMSWSSSLGSSLVAEFKLDFLLNINVRVRLKAGISRGIADKRHLNILGKRVTRESQLYSARVFYDSVAYLLSHHEVDGEHKASHTLAVVQHLYNADTRKIVRAFNHDDVTFVFIKALEGILGRALAFRAA